MKCEEEEACNYFSWTDSTNIGYNDSQNHKLCYLKNENSTGLRDKDGIVSGKKGCIMFQGMYIYGYHDFQRSIMYPICESMQACVQNQEFCFLTQLLLLKASESNLKKLQNVPFKVEYCNY